MDGKFGWLGSVNIGTIQNQLSNKNKGVNTYTKNLFEYWKRIKVNIHFRSEVIHPDILAPPTRSEFHDGLFSFAGPLAIKLNNLFACQWMILGSIPYFHFYFIISSRWRSI